MDNNWELVIGLEVHAQLKTESKLFSSSPNQFGSDPNSNVNFIDAGMPGMLPVMNFGCIEKAIKTGFALNFQINPYSVFERKITFMQTCHRVIKLVNLNFLYYLKVILKLKMIMF